MKTGLISLLFFFITVSNGLAYQTIFHSNEQLPFTVFSISFRTGSANDPEKKQGLCNLTAETMREGGVQAMGSLQARNREQIEAFLFPLATEIQFNVSKEQTTIEARAAAQDAEKVFDLITQMILVPAWDESQFKRIKSENLDYLEKQLPSEDQEELGKMVLDRQIYGKNHPYAHPVSGTRDGVRSVSLEDLKKFHTSHFTQDRVLVTAAGVISKSLKSKMQSAFKLLPKSSPKTVIKPAPQESGVHLTLVKGPFAATGVHIGLPLEQNRASKDFPLLVLGNMAFGKHRSFVGRLMHNVREVRGLNYGTYSYVEDFPQGGARLTEPTNVARQKQAFTIWARPTPEVNGCFLLRQVFREFESLRKVGITKKEFELTRSHLIGTAPLLANNMQRKLGYEIDSSFYGIKGDYLKILKQGASNATLGSVNKVLKKSLSSPSIQIVVVTANPEEFKKQVFSDQCDIHYAAGIEKAADVLKEDEQISKTKIPNLSSEMELLESDSVF